ncbi:hypothetical protein T11_8098 [Trichinella zimbabwensis]|uniref:Uncharacterized protein n=1 Tax=Trichinella zimbabwensis TaxID=268475 RepID=A0A0V1HTR7_9BILA|nr:hypothetical protein T11_8098 [Trichinella zimbabwensis]
MQINNLNCISKERHVSIPFETELGYYAVNINGKIKMNVHQCKYSQPSTFAVCAFRRNHECRISANTCRFYSYTPLMPYNPSQLYESCKGYHGPSTDLHVKYLSRIYFFIRLIESGWTVRRIFLKKHCEYSSFMHYVFTQILRYSHAVVDCASLKAEVWTCPDMSGLVSKRLESRDRCYRTPSRSQRLLSLHPSVFIFFILALVALI